MRLNTATKPTEFTHEGAPAKHIDPVAQLRRLCMSCLLWERQFYADGQDIASAIGEAVAAVDRNTVQQIAIEARELQNLRHLPLYLLALLAHQKGPKPGLASVIARVVQRADELAELVAIWGQVSGVNPKSISKLPSQMKKGLAAAFGKFDAYQLAKYDRANAITLLDVARLVHPQHTDAIGGLVKGALATPDTWEVALSSGADKRETWERLIGENRLGYLALLRNLRNMDQAGVDKGMIKGALRERKGAHRVLPFRYVAAAIHAPWAADALNDALLDAVAGTEPFGGLTWVLIDTSGSMQARLSERSDLTRVHAAAALGAVWPGEKRVVMFASEAAEAPAHRGLPLVDHIGQSLGRVGHGTDIAGAIRACSPAPNDRMVVITDEQSATRVGDPPCRGYMINVASYQNGVGYGGWTHIDGWSENVFKFIHELEG